MSIRIDNGGGGLDTTAGDLRYLRLDASNDPVTGELVIQPAVDSTTGFQVLDADGGTPILNVDTDNERVGVNTVAPAKPFHVYNVGFGDMQLEGSSGARMIMRRNNVAAQAAFLFLTNAGDIEWTIGCDINEAAGANGFFFDPGWGAVATATMFFDQNGNIGMGSIAPGERLVIGDDNAKVAFGTGEDASIYYDGTDLYINTQEVGTGDLIIPNGNVGIGVTNPSDICDIQKDQNDLTRVAIKNATDDTAAGSGYLALAGSGDITSFFYSLNSSYTTSGALVASSGVMGSNGIGGYSLAAYNADGVLRVYTGGLTAANERMRVTSTGEVGINTTSPSAKLDVIDNSASAGAPRCIISTQYTTDNQAPQFNFKKSRGTEGSPALVESGDAIGNLNYWAYDGTAFESGARIMTLANQNWDNASHGCYLIFQTTEDSTTTVTERMRILDDGSIGIGNPSPNTFVEIASNDPYLTLHNYTHENTVNSRESQLIFRGEKSDGSEDVLALIEGAHDGGGDDFKGKLRFKTDTGGGGGSPGVFMEINSSGWTHLGDGISDGVIDNPLDVDSSTNPQFRIQHTDGTGHQDYATFGVDGDGQLDIISNDGLAGTNAHITLQPQGFVGLFDSDPDSPLEILHTSQPQFRISHTDGTHDFTIGVSDAGVATLTSSAGEIILASGLALNLSSTTAFVVEDNGTVDDVLVVDTVNTRVGIGIAPDVTLDARVSLQGSPVIIRAWNTSNAASSDARFIAFVGGTSGGDAYSRYGVSGGPQFGFGYDTSEDEFKFVYEAATNVSMGSTSVFVLDNSNNAKLPTDSGKIFLGAGDDASIFYNGTDLHIDSQEVGSGHIVLDSPKTTTGDPAGVEGKIYWNTVDNVLKMYADGGWRTLASW